MAVYTYNAVLKGVGRINSALIYLEKIPVPHAYDPDVIPIFLKATSPSEKEWKKSKIKLDVKGKLDYKLVVNAVSGTKWDFTLNETTSKRKVIDLSEEKTGSVVSNKSVVGGSEDPD